jgi:hypothetical protein
MESGGIVPLFLISALDGSEKSASRLDRFAPGKEPPVTIAKDAGWAQETI